MRPDSPKGAIQSRQSRDMVPPENFVIVGYQRYDFMYKFGGNQVFMIIKLDVVSSTVSPF